MRDDLVSVIIVNFNSGKHLLECVRSLLQQTHPIEIIISDNGSADESIMLVKQAFGNEPRLVIVENQRNLGFSKGNNIGLQHAHGAYILFLNPDCVVMPQTILRMKQVMDANLKAGMAGCLVRNSDGTIQESCVRSIPSPWNSLVRVLHLDKLFPKSSAFQGVNLATKELPVTITSVPGISGAFMFVRRQAIDQIGPLDENYFLYCEDTDWMYRFQQAAWQILFVPDAEVIHIKGVCGKNYPFKILWHKHIGMTRFYSKFFRHQYFFAFNWLTYAAIWSRFIVLMITKSFSYGLNWRSYKKNI